MKRVTFEVLRPEVNNRTGLEHKGIYFGCVLVCMYYILPATFSNDGSVVVSERPIIFGSSSAAAASVAHTQEIGAGRTCSVVF